MRGKREKGKVKSGGMEGERKGWDERERCRGEREREREREIFLKLTLKSGLTD